MMSTAAVKVLLSWAPLLSLLLVPPAIFILLAAFNKAFWHYNQERLWKIAVITSFVIVAVTHVGFAIMSMQFLG